MIGSIVSINDRESDLYCSQGEVININNNKATVMILRPHTLNFRQAWDCIVENTDINKLRGRDNE